MNDLISRSALLKALEKEERECEDAGMVPSWWSAYNIIKNQPTVFNRDKVMEELTKQWNDVVFEDDDYSVGRASALDDAVEIVQRGGVDG